MKNAAAAVFKAAIKAGEEASKAVRYNHYDLGTSITMEARPGEAVIRIKRDPRHRTDAAEAVLDAAKAAAEKSGASYRTANRGLLLEPVYEVVIYNAPEPEARKKKAKTTPAEAVKKALKDGNVTVTWTPEGKIRIIQGVRNENID